MSIARIISIALLSVGSASPIYAQDVSGHARAVEKAKAIHASQDAAAAKRQAANVAQRQARQDRITKAKAYHASQDAAANAEKAAHVQRLAKAHAYHEAQKADASPK